MTFSGKRRDVTRALMGLPFLLSRHANAADRAIDEAGFIKAGGIDQWVSIQGRDTANPVILFLHGGPAEAQSPFLKEFLPWERDFTVVNWDQRGSGKTYGKNGSSTPGMDTPEAAVNQLVTDAIDITAYVSSRLSKKKLILVGQSWGSMLGLHVVRRQPDLFHALVGTGQVVNWARGFAELERMARVEATDANDQETLKALDNTASLPTSDPRRRGATMKYRMVPADLAYLHIVDAFVGPPPMPTHGDAADWIGGNIFSGPRISPAMYSFDAATFAPEVPVPFFVIEGRDDHVTPARLASEYLSQVKAPRKAYTAIAGGHYACFTNAKEFVEILRRDLTSVGV